MNQPHRLGLISDTHGLLRPEALDALAGSDLIVHAGDIGDPAILTALEKLAPVIAVRGNVDTLAWARRLPGAADFTLGGLRGHVRHIREEIEGLDPKWRLVVVGHSHRPRIAELDGGRLLVNPGSAGPRRFSLPVTLAVAEVTGGEVSAQLVELI